MSMCIALQADESVSIGENGECMGEGRREGGKEEAKEEILTRDGHAGQGSRHRALCQLLAVDKGRDDRGGVFRKAVTRQSRRDGVALQVRSALDAVRPKDERGVINDGQDRSLR